MRFRTKLSVAAFVLTLSAGLAQGPLPQPVQWKASLAPETPLKAGDRVNIDLSGAVEAGWHVYALTQPPGGPIPLRVSVDENDVAQSRGEPTGAAPIKKQDPSFQLETQLYEGDFTLQLPILVKHPSAGKQLIPLSVRFQACNDRVCMPPRTVRLSLPVQVASTK
jgi:hypothetical protein